jgi:hypothetical protein
MRVRHDGARDACQKAATGSNSDFATCCVTVLPACEHGKLSRSTVFSVPDGSGIEGTAGWETWVRMEGGPQESTSIARFCLGSAASCIPRHTQVTGVYPCLSEVGISTTGIADANWQT